MSDEQPALEQLTQFHLYSTARADGLREQLNRADAEERFFALLVGHLRRGHNAHAWHLFEQEAVLLKTWRAEDHAAIPVLEATWRAAKDIALKEQRRFAANIERLAQEAGLVLDRDSRHPRYTIEGGFIFAEIDDARCMARLGNVETRLGEIPADVPAVVESLVAERERLFDRRFDGPEFLKLVRTHYLAVLKKKQLPDGESLPIRTLTRRLNGYTKAFRVDEFLVDLSRLSQNGPLDIDDTTLDLQQTKDTSQGVLLPGLANRGYVGFIRFRRPV